MYYNLPQSAAEEVKTVSTESQESKRATTNIDGHSQYICPIVSLSLVPKLETSFKTIIYITHHSPKPSGADNSSL
jgi:hypothetical protein